jgi:hypothetical protein
MNRDHACSYIAKSKCKAPTVDFGLPTHPTKTGDDLKALYEITYVEYSDNSINPDISLETMSIPQAATESKIDILGG